MKKSSLLWLLIFCAILSACGSQGGLPVLMNVTPPPSAMSTTTSTLTPIPRPTIPRLLSATWTSTPTEAVTRTFTPTQKPRPTSTVWPTETFLPTPYYRIKQVLFDYYSVGSHTLFDVVLDPVFSSLVLYSDGQMISPGEGLQKKLSEKEMAQFFAQLKALGFYTLETDADGNSTEKLYTPDNPFERIYDAASYCVLTITLGRRRNICAYEPYVEYLAPEMKNVLKFLDEYPTQGMTPYIPDRILLAVALPYKDEFSESQMEAAVLWPERFPPLKFTKSDNYAYTVMYFQGKMAAEISAFLEDTDPILFRQNDQEYTVFLDTILPHEKLDFSSIEP